MKNESLLDVSAYETKRLAKIICLLVFAAAVPALFVQHIESHVGKNDYAVGAIGNHLKFLINVRDFIEVNKQLGSLMMDTSIEGYNLLDGDGITSIARYERSTDQYVTMQLSDSLSLRGTGFLFKRSYTPLVLAPYSLVLISYFDLLPILKILLFTSIISFLIYVLIKRSFKKVVMRLIQPISNLSLAIASESSLDKTPFESEDVCEEYRVLSSAILERENLKSKLVKLERDRSVIEMAKQVAHDIRSPLAALRIIFANSVDLGGEDRNLSNSIISRIENIAKNLLYNNVNAEKALCLVYESLRKLVDEKKITSSQSTVSISIECIGGAFSAAIICNPVEFERAISNLLNNAIESLSGKGAVAVVLSIKDNSCSIVIKDNGRGIPPNILSKLKEQSFSWEKEGGLGLGLSHAKSFIKGIGGSFRIESDIGIGTSCFIEIELACLPDFICTSLELSKNSKLHVHVDVYNSSPKLFQESCVHIFKKLTDLDVNAPGMTILAPSLFFSQLDKKNSSNFIDSISLVDSFASTSPCEVNTRRVLPKCFLDHFKVYRTDSFAAKTCVHIEDDEILRQAWRIEAKSASVQLISVSCFEDVKHLLPTIPKTATFYIDYDLGTGKFKGDEIARVLFSQGFKELFICSGYDAEYFKSMSYVKGFVSKQGPW